MSAADFARVARDLDTLIPRTKKEAMQRVVTEGESIMKREVPVKLGALRRSITSKEERGGDRGRVGTNMPYARAVHDGTGIYGPKKKRIKPVTKKALFWKGAAHPYRSVKGQKPNAFIPRTRERLRPIAERELRKEFGRALARVG